MINYENDSACIYIFFILNFTQYQTLTSRIQISNIGNTCSFNLHHHLAQIWIPVLICVSMPLFQVLEADSGPAGALRRLRRLSLLLLLQRKAWDETFHFNAARLLCSQGHLAHCRQGQEIWNTKHYSLLLWPQLWQRPPIPLPPLRPSSLNPLRFSWYHLICVWVREAIFVCFLSVHKFSVLY